jgi:hypothetical protein
MPGQVPPSGHTCQTSPKSAGAYLRACPWSGVTSPPPQGILPGAIGSGSELTGYPSQNDETDWGRPSALLRSRSSRGERMAGLTGASWHPAAPSPAPAAPGPFFRSSSTCFSESTSRSTASAAGTPLSGT